MDNEIIIAGSEQTVTAIGSNGKNDFFAFLTERRLYFKGKSYSFDSKRWVSSRVEGVVALEDVSFTKFMHTQNIGYLITAIVMTVLAFYMAWLVSSISFWASYFTSAYELIFGVFAVLAVIYYVRYFRSRKSLFWVNFPGGGFAFEAQGYQIGEIRHFQRMLHLLKDKRRAIDN